MALTVCLALTIPFVLLSPATAMARYFAHWGARLLRVLCFMPLQLRGLEHLPARPHLLVVNHASYLDALLLTAALPPKPGYAYVVKQELAELPLVGRMLTRIGMLYIDRRNPNKGLSQVYAMARHLADGSNLVVFPEGTFKADPNLQPFRMGGFAAAARAGVPVQVAAVLGTREALPDGEWRPRPRVLALHVGSLHVPTGEGWDAAEQLCQAAHAEMLRLLQHTA